MTPASVHAATVRPKGRCFVWMDAPERSGATLADLLDAFKASGWEIVAIPAVDSMGLLRPGRNDIILVENPAAAGLEFLRRLKSGNAMLSCLNVSSDLSPEIVACCDVFLCSDPNVTQTLRSRGKAAHHVPIGKSRVRTHKDILERHWRYRSEIERFPQVDWSRISYGHEAISANEVSEKMIHAWQSEDIPARQRALVQTELAEMYRGRTPVVYQVLAEALKNHVANDSSILEIGCASGYYSEILEYLLNKRLRYVGVDYSQALIRMAKSFYPNTPFLVSDGSKLPFEDNRFPIVISSCVLLHVPNYREHIRETARVAGEIIVAHRTPIRRRATTQHQRKFAYGIETMELIFNEVEFLKEFEAQGFLPVGGLEFSADAAQDQFAVTYVFERKGKRGDPIFDENEGNAKATGNMENTVEAALPGLDLIERGEDAFAQGDFEQAEALFIRASRLEPESPRLLNDLGVLAFQAGDLARALEFFRRAYQGSIRDKGKPNRNFMMNLADAMISAGSPEKAQSLYAEFLQHFPEDEEVKRHREKSGTGTAPIKVLWQNRNDMDAAPGGDTTVVREIMASLSSLGTQASLSLLESPDLRDQQIVQLNNISRTRDTLAQLANARAQGKKTVLVSLYEDMDRYLVPAMKTDLLFRYLATQKKILPLEALSKVRDGFELSEHPLDNPMAKYFGIGDPEKQRTILEGVDYILTSGKGESDSIRKKFGSHLPIGEMHYGFNRKFQDADPRPFIAKHGLKDFALCVGRLEPRKNQWQLIEVFRQLPHIKLVLIGVFSDPSMEHLIKAYAPPNVIFFNRLPFHELVSAYAAARLHVLPSWYELPGLVSLEAAVAGCRIVSTDWGTAPDYLGDRVAYCSPQDPISIRNAVQKAFDSEKHPDLRNHILQNFSWDHAAKRCRQVYADLLAR